MHDELKRRFDFASWRGINNLRQDVLLWRYRPRGTELEGWEIGASREINPPRAPRFLPSMWRRPGRTGGFRSEALRLDTYECASRDAAHETVIRLLGEFSAPVVHRITDAGFGDVTFAGGNLSALLFARANLVFFMADVGRTSPGVAGVADLAAQLDRDLVKKPPTVVGGGVARPVAVANALPGPSSLLNLDVDLPRAAMWGGAIPPSGPQRKLFARACALSVDEDLVVVRAEPHEAGPQLVEVYTMEPQGDWEVNDVTIEGLNG